MQKIILSLFLIFSCFIISAQTEFITTWKTDNPGTSADNQITIPTNFREIYDYTISWGDGTTDTNVRGSIIHTYESPGIYQVSISGLFPRIYFNGDYNYYSTDKNKILSVDQWGAIDWSSMSSAFSGCNNLEIVAVDEPNLANVSSMNNMFSSCTSLIGNIFIANWDTSSVTTMKEMFSDAVAFSQNISDWNVSNVTDMTAMFRSAKSFNGDINGWNVSNVTTMEEMFSDTEAFNKDISNWDLSNVKDMSGMFKSSKSFNQNISTWDVSNVVTMEEMFSGSEAFNQDISNWDVSNVMNMMGMFKSTKSFNQNISKWNVVNVTTMKEMFSGAVVFNKGISDWNLANVLTMEEMFSETDVFNQDITNLDVSNVTDMTGMFRTAKLFNQDLGNWDVENVEKMDYMFDDSALSNENYDKILIGWSTLNLQGRVTLGANKSFYCNSKYARNSIYHKFRWKFNDEGDSCPFIPFESIWNTSETGVTANNQIRIPVFPEATYDYDIEWGDGTYDLNVTGEITHTYETPGGYKVSIHRVFPQIYFNGELSSVENDKLKLSLIEQWGDVEWQSFENAFSGCSNLDVRSNDAPNLNYTISTKAMFENCSSLRGNSSFNDWIMSNIIDMSSMFYDCTIFNQNIGNWNVSNVVNMENVFKRAERFNQEIGDWNVSNVTNMGYMFQGAKAFDKPIGSWNVINVASMFHMFSDAYKFNQDIGNWDMSNVTDIGSMFAQAYVFNQDISNWDIGNVTNMRILFSNAYSFNQNIGGWDVSNITDMRALFNGAHAFNQDISNWDVSNVTIMDAMFQGARSFNQDISSWEVSQVFDMDNIFSYAVAFEQDISNWNISNVESMREIFKGISLSTENYDKILIGWSNLPTLPSGILFNGGKSQYCLSAVQRQKLIDDNNWSFIDGNENCTQEPFITIWQTDIQGATENNQIRIPAHPDEYYDYTVDWGDGTIDNNVHDTKIHTYESPGTYEVTISGEFPRIYFNGSWDFPKLLSIEQWGDNLWTSMEQAFSKCRNLDIKATDIPNLELVTDYSYAFASCESLVGNETMNDWDVSNAKKMNGVFTSALLFNQDIGDWDVGNVVEIISMFSNADEFNQNIGNWNLSSAESIRAIFSGAKSFNQDIGNWDVSNVTNMSHAFYNTGNFNQDISNWDISNVVYIDFMFFGAKTFNQPIGKWNTSNLTSIKGLLWAAPSFNQTLADWDIGNITRMDNFLSGTALSMSNYDDTLIGWNNQSPNTSVTMDVRGHSYCASQQARQNLIDLHGWRFKDDEFDCSANYFKTTWITSNFGASENNQITIPTYPNELYNYTIDWGDGIIDTNVIGNITHTYTSEGTYQVSIMGDFPGIYFDNSGDREKIISVDNWGDIEWASMKGAFHGCSNLEILATDVPDFNQVLTLENMFTKCTTMVGTVYMTFWNLHKVKNLSHMFEGATNFNSLIENWNTVNVEEMTSMFNGATSFNRSIGIWDVGNVISMRSMFQNASDFRGYINDWDVFKVIDMSSMFKEASSYNANIGNWQVDNVTRMDGMFAGALLFNQDLKQWNVGKVTDMNNMFANSAFNQDIGNWDVSSVENMNSMFKGAKSFDQNLGSWNISQVSDMDAIFEEGLLSIINYDALLNGWSQLSSLTQNVIFDGGNSQFCASQDSREFLINHYGWEIYDSGRSDLCEIDIDQDGVLDYFDNCLNTPLGATVDDNGCMIITSDFYNITSIQESCPDKNNGQIIIEAAYEFEYAATLNNIEYSFNKDLIIDNLEPGIYNLCISKVDLENTRCFEFSILESQQLTGKTVLENNTTENKLLVTMDKGTFPYSVTINNNKIGEYKSKSFSFSVLEGDIIEISSKYDCEGKIALEIPNEILDDSFANPVNEIIDIQLTENNTIVLLELFDMNGRLLESVKEYVINNRISMKMTKFPRGLYMIKIQGDTNRTYKLLKR
ncbi:MAG: BspA family leucine-rich repeat surface protein [Maribacter stanieri]